MAESKGVRIEDVVRALETGGPSVVDRLYTVNWHEWVAEQEEKTYTESGVGWSILAGMIAEAYREEGFIAIIVSGRQGVGKSVYAIKVAYDALRRLGFLGKHHTTEKVFKEYMAFTAESFMEKLEHAYNEGVRLPLIIWDDAGLEASSYLFFTDPIMAKALTDLFKVIRTSASAVIFTTPSPTDILKPMRTYDTVIVRVERLDKVWSRAHIYQFHNLVGHAWIKRIANEDFKRRLRTYHKYREIRRQYVGYAVGNLKELLKRRKLKRMLEMEKEKQKAIEMGLDPDSI